MGAGHELINCPNLFRLFDSYYIPTMSLASRLKKVRLKGAVRELKIVDAVNCCGSDVLTLEEVKTPKKRAALTSQCNLSSSPIKHPKLEAFEAESFPSDLDDASASKKHQTLVFVFHHNQKLGLKFAGPKRLFEAVLGP